MVCGYVIYHSSGAYTISLADVPVDGFVHLYVTPNKKYCKYDTLEEAFDQHPYHILAGQTMPNVIVPFTGLPGISPDPPAT
jgi:hypothetical protein